MSISSETARVDYVGNESTLTYSYTFLIFSDDHLQVIVKNPDTLAETVLTKTTHYSVTGVDSITGGTVVLVAGVFDWISSSLFANDWVLSIRRVVPLTQLADIRNQGAYYPEIHEDEFDLLTMADQQQQDELDRALTLPETEAGTDANTTLPSASDRANTYLGFDSSGNPIAVASAASSASVTAFMATVLDDATGPIAMTTIRGSLAAETAPAVDDELFLYDLSATTVDKITLANLFKVIDALSAETAPDVADEVPLYDASASTTDKITLSNLLKVINTLTADATPDMAADYIVTYDASAAAAKKVLLNSFNATQADMEAATSAVTHVTPAMVQSHPGVAKAWVKFDASSGTPTANASRNFTSFTDNGVGDFTINWAITFSSANYCVVGMGGNNSTPVISAQTASTVRVVFDLLDNTAGTNVDTTYGNIVAFGDI